MLTSFEFNNRLKYRRIQFIIKIFGIRPIIDFGLSSLNELIFNALLQNVTPHPECNPLLLFHISIGSLPSSAWMKHSVVSSNAKCILKIVNVLFL